MLLNNITNEKFLFPCGRWLAKDELDHKIELELTCEAANLNKNTKSNLYFSKRFIWVKFTD